MLKGIPPILSPDLMHALLGERAALPPRVRHGAAGGMTLAVMSRAALGHTGRPLVVATPIAIAYLSIAAAAFIRSLGLDLFPADYYIIMALSGGLWIVGFALFAVIYLPILAFSEKRAAA